MQRRPSLRNMSFRDSSFGRSMPPQVATPNGTAVSMADGGHVGAPKNMWLGGLIGGASRALGPMARNAVGPYMGGLSNMLGPGGMALTGSIAGAAGAANQEGKAAGDPGLSTGPLPGIGGSLWGAGADMLSGMASAPGGKPSADTYMGIVPPKGGFAEDQRPQEWRAALADQDAGASGTSFPGYRPRSAATPSPYANSNLRAMENTMAGDTTASHGAGTGASLIRGMDNEQLGNDVMLEGAGYRPKPKPYVESTPGATPDAPRAPQARGILGNVNTSFGAPGVSLSINGQRAFSGGSAHPGYQPSTPTPMPSAQPAWHPPGTAAGAQGTIPSPDGVPPPNGMPPGTIRMKHGGEVGGPEHLAAYSAARELYLHHNGPSRMKFGGRVYNCCDDGPHRGGGMRGS